MGYHDHHVYIYVIMT